MKSRYIKLGSLLAVMLLFLWSHRHYTRLYHETSDRIAVMQYEMLDNKMWSMSSEEKARAFASEGVYQEMQMLEEQKEGAQKKSEIGFWLSVLFTIAFGLYLINVLGRIIYLTLIKDAGYKGVIERIRRWRSDDDNAA